MALFYKRCNGCEGIYQVHVWGLVQIANPRKIARGFVKYRAITIFPAATYYTAPRLPLQEAQHKSITAAAPVVQRFF